MSLKSVRRWRKKNPARVKEYARLKERRAQRTGNQRRYYVKKNGYAECTDYPSPPVDNKCAICHRDAGKGVHYRGLALDHEHVTGKFRGYLCRDCNMGLGMLGDTVEAIRRVLAYLEHLGE
jgi:hypothetical protein